MPVAVLLIVAVPVAVLVLVLVFVLLVLLVEPAPAPPLPSNRTARPQPMSSVNNRPPKRTRDRALRWRENKRFTPPSLLAPPCPATMS